MQGDQTPPDLGQTLLQVGPLLLFFEKVPTSVVEPRRVVVFFLNANKARLTTGSFNTAGTDQYSRRVLGTRSSSPATL